MLTPSQSTSCTGGSACKGECNNAELVGRFFTKILVDSYEFKQPPLAGHGN